MIVFAHPTGNANVRSACYGLYEADSLYEFYTTLASFQGDILDKLGSIKPFSELRRRNFQNELKPITRQWPWRELGRQLSSKVGLNQLTKHETGFFCIDAVCGSLDRKVASNLTQAAKHGVHSVYSYEDEALFTFREAKKLGLECLYDLPIGYWRSARKLLEIERERWPDWVPTLTGFKDSEIKLARKDEELQLADRIFVASSFTAKTLLDFPKQLAPITVIPYGFPPVSNFRNYSFSNRGHTLKLLFVGGLSQRKGIANLFTAVNFFGNRVELTIVGRKASNNCPALDLALMQHRWIPSLPHDKILALMRENDVLVFPSLFEGFGLVISEAMSQGTPVITTDRTAGPDLISHGNNGWLIEAGSTEALKIAIDDLLTNPQNIAKAGKAAMETAINRPWSVYGRELSQAILKK